MCHPTRAGGGDRSRGFDKRGKKKKGLGGLTHGRDHDDARGKKRKKRDRDGDDKKRGKKKTKNKRVRCRSRA